MEQCERTIDIEEVMARQEQSINRAFVLGYTGRARSLKTS